MVVFCLFCQFFASNSLPPLPLTSCEIILFLQLAACVCHAVSCKMICICRFFFFMSTTNLLKYARSISFMIESRESVLLMIYAFPPSRALMPGAAALGGSKMSPIPLP